MKKKNIIKVFIKTNMTAIKMCVNSLKKVKKVFEKIECKIDENRVLEKKQEYKEKTR